MTYPPKTEHLVNKIANDDVSIEQQIKKMEGERSDDQLKCILMQIDDIFGYNSQPISTDGSEMENDDMERGNEDVFIQVMDKKDECDDVDIDEFLNKPQKRKTILMNEERKGECKKSSYQRKEESYVKKLLTLSDVEDICETKEICIKFLVEMGILNKNYKCPICNSEMTMCKNTSSRSSSDIYVWVCRRTYNGERHQVHRSIRRSSKSPSLVN